MPKLRLEDVTLATTACVCHELAAAALQTCMANAEFDDVIVASDRPLNVGERWIASYFDKGSEAAEWVWQQSNRYLETSHMLYVQWDSWIINPARWDPAWLQYDYIGAPWTDRAPHIVGNGGFTLWSRRLLRFLDRHRDEFPPRQPWEDSILGREYRARLEPHGFRWPTTQEAEKFAFENRPQVREGAFGFHGIFNWPRVISEAEMQHRIAMFDDHAWKSPTLNRLPQHLLRRAKMPA